MANQTTSDGVWNYSYDNERNLIARTNIATGANWTYGYNLNNQLLSAVQKDNTGAVLQTVTYVYDPFGDMLSETVTPTVGPAAVTAWVHDVTSATTGINQQANPVVMQLDGSGTVIERFLFDPNGNALARSGTTTTGTAWLLTDRLGSVREVLNASGALVDQLNYDAFGQTISESASNWTGNYTFQGLRSDNATGILWAKYRGTLSDGQWNAEDQTGFGAGDANLRRADGNNNINETDPSGLAPLPSSGGSLHIAQVLYRISQAVELAEYDAWVKTLLILTGAATTTKLGYEMHNYLEERGKELGKTAEQVAPAIVATASTLTSGTDFATRIPNARNLDELGFLMKELRNFRGAPTRRCAWRSVASYN